MNDLEAKVGAKVEAKAEGHLRDILTLSLEHGPDQSGVVVYDKRSPLARTLTDAYRRCLPQAIFLDFDALPAERVLASFDPLRPSDLVVLVQSANFRLEAFRLRVELFKRGLKVIEHPHLERMSDRKRNGTWTPWPTTPPTIE